MTKKLDKSNAQIIPEVHVPPQYRVLYDALLSAFDQAAFGKGRERHANERAFQDQTILETARAHGIGYQTGQAEKKLREAHTLLTLDNGPARAKAEIKGAIIYAAAALIRLNELYPDEV